MKKVKILKKPKKSKINKSLIAYKDEKKNKANKQKPNTPLSKTAQSYLNFYDDIKTTNQIYDW